MRKNFAYTKTNASADALTEAFVQLSSMSLDNKNNTEEYKAGNALFSENIIKYSLEGTGMEFSGVDMVKNPMVHNNIIFKSRFSTVLAQAITPVVPMVVASGYDQLYDVQQVGYGDVGKYTVQSNELYIVNDIAEGIRRGAQQTIYNQEYTIQASRKQIAVFVDWYQVAAGIHDWGVFGKKIGASYAAEIQKMVVDSIAKVVGSGSSYGVSGYIVSSMTDNNWLTIARNVKLANGGAQVYAIGTEIALGKVLPNGATASSFRYGPDSEIVKDGYLPVYKNVPMIPLGNALRPDTINGSVTAIVPDTVVYFVAMGAYKPVKVLIEGENVAISEDPTSSRDHSYSMAIDMRIGADCVVGSKFGAITGIN